MQSGDGTKIHAWLIEPKPPYKGTGYFLHGNAQNISTHFQSTVWLLENGYQIFGLDYRGYGLSEGIADVPEVFGDIAAGAQWLDDYLPKVDGVRQSPLFLLGQSLGGSLAITYAQSDPQFEQRFDGLITEAAFARFDTIAKQIASQHWLTWAAQYPAQWFIQRKFDPLDAISQLEGVPKLLIHSKDDGIVPYRFGQQLLNAAAEPKQWASTGGRHIRAAADPVIRSTILSFMQRYGRPEIQPIR